MSISDYILSLFQEGLLCDCIRDPSWDRIYDNDNRFIGYELAHDRDCTGRLKAAETLKELNNEQV